MSFLKELLFFAVAFTGILIYLVFEVVSHLCKRLFGLNPK